MNDEHAQSPYGEDAPMKRSLVDRAKNMITTPKTEWGVVAAETPDVGGITTGYALPLIVISAIATMIGYGLIGLPGLGNIGFDYGIAQAVAAVIQGLVGLFLAAGVLKVLGPSFSSTDDFGRAFQLVAYSYTPIWIAGIFMILPILGGLAFFAGLVYTIYLIYIGLTPVMDTPQDKVVAFMIVSALVMIVASIVIGLLLTPIILGFFGLSVLSGGLF